jgi:hypothetical protein
MGGVHAKSDELLVCVVVQLVDVALLLDQRAEVIVQRGSHVKLLHLFREGIQELPHHSVVLISDVSTSHERSAERDHFATEFGHLASES